MRNIIIILSFVLLISCSRSAGDKAIPVEKNSNENPAKPAAVETTSVENTDKPAVVEKRTPMHVTTPDGLNVRGEPSTSGEKLFTLKYKTRVYAKEPEEIHKAVIDGFNDYWREIEYNGKSGWVFGAYLDTLKPMFFEDKTISHQNITGLIPGEWRAIQDPRNNSYAKSIIAHADFISGMYLPGKHYSFDWDNTYFMGLEETSFGGEGIWKSDGKMLYLTSNYYGDDSNESTEGDDVEYSIHFKNKNIMVLTETQNNEEDMFIRKNVLLDRIIEDNDYLELEEYLASGYEFNENYEQGLTPLMNAIRRQREDMALLLLESGSDVNAVDNSGKSPLHHACERRMVTIASRLLELGAEVNALDDYGQTPLDFLIYGYKDTDNDSAQLYKLMKSCQAKPQKLQEIPFQYRGYSDDHLLQPLE